MGSTSSSATSLNTRFAMIRDTTIAQANVPRQPVNTQAEQQPHDDGRGKADKGCTRLAIRLLEFFLVRHESRVPFLSHRIPALAPHRAGRNTVVRAIASVAYSPNRVPSLGIAARLSIMSPSPPKAQGAKRRTVASPLLRPRPPGCSSLEAQLSALFATIAARARPSRSACPQASRTCR